MKSVAVLCAMMPSIYDLLPGVEVWNRRRDVRNFAAACRWWRILRALSGGGLRHFANDVPEEKELGPLCVAWVRECGGVLEHPAGSALWEACGMPRPGEEADEFGGWSMTVNQSWFGHRAQKKTWLYVVGIERAALPRLALKWAEPECVVTVVGVRGADDKPEVRRYEREATPRKFADWLVAIARASSAELEAA
jgi:hypothetical protein